jgi:hypothetical protein
MCQEQNIVLKNQTMDEISSYVITLDDVSHSPGHRGPKAR